MIRLTDQEFQNIVSYIKNNYGINLANKRQLIEARMYSVLVEKGLKNFSEYLTLIQQPNNSEEITQMLNKLTTNHTYFMREPAHFEFIKTKFLPAQERFNRRRSIRIWSAGCSSGEEAYTTSMVLKDYFSVGRPGWDFRILATDISEKAMSAGKNATYSAEALKNVPPSWLTRYFMKQGTDQYRINDDVRRHVTFQKLNLMLPFPPMQPFDLIFCRNVMIYFDQEDRNKLINKYYEMLNPGGYLLIGHSETIQRDSSKFIYLEPSVYQKG
ncbi:CheR family methyltransferase [Clostridium minihomine]|uniref:CheR family methyltransferase n=1 Tax=Clostridium minihomine TaxID=2045012 RepID=UPI000C77C7D1|nr:protein-glutamate O-methyltransferase [Clostridium minihomine]